MSMWSFRSSGNRLPAAYEAFELLPTCLFIRALDAHLRQYGKLEGGGD